jgi:hypothetical protein
MEMMIPDIVANDNRGRWYPAYKLSIDELCDMRFHADWWAEARGRLEWQPIASYIRFNSDEALANPMILRTGDTWVFGCWHESRWVRVSEGASWPLDHFQPEEWAEPTLEDHVRLMQE